MLTLIAKTILACAMLVLIFGCQPPISPATQADIVKIHDQMVTQHQTDLASIQSVKDQAAKALESAKGANLIIKQKGIDLPAFHPMAAANQTVSELHPIVMLVTVIAFVLWAACFGLSIAFPQMLFLPRLSPVFRTIAIVSLVTLFALPYFPYGLYAIFGIVLALWVYEAIRDKGNIRQSFIDTEKDLGIKSTVTTAATPDGIKTTVQTTAITPSPAVQ